MKKIIVLILCSMFSLGSFAQDKEKEQHRKQIKALKVAYITQQMNMDSKLAQKFWPIYNWYENKRMELHRREHRNLGDVDNISETRAEEILSEYLSVEKEEYLIKKQLYNKLKEILSAKQIVKLHKLESEFNRKLLKEYRAKQAAEKSNREE
jgi:hypothetical protein